MQPPLSIQTVGHIANDLDASNIAEDGDDNVMALIFRVDRDPQQASTLIPSFPMLTFTRDITFNNELPMEIGCDV